MYLVAILWLLEGDIEDVTTIDVVATYQGCGHAATDYLKENEESVATMKAEDKIPAVVCLRLPDYDEEGKEMIDSAAVKI